MLNSNIRMTIVWSQLMVNMQHAIFIVGETGRLFGSKDFPHKVALFSHLLTPFMGVFLDNSAGARGGIPLICALALLTRAGGLPMRYFSAALSLMGQQQRTCMPRLI